MVRRRKTDVLVVGAGPVGLFAAAAFAERGVKVEIIDSAWQPATHGYAIALHPMSLELLDCLGVAEHLIERGRRIDMIGFYQGMERRDELDLGRLEAPFPFALSVPQRLLEGALSDCLKKLHVKVRWNHRLAALAGADGEVAATVHRLDRVSGGYPVATMTEVVTGTTVITARFVIGADGHGSLVRRSLEATFEPAADPELYAVFELSAASASPSGEMRVVIDDNGCGGLWPLAGDRCRWSFQLSGRPLPPHRNQRRPMVEIGGRAYPEIAEVRLAELLTERAPWFTQTVEEIFWSVAIGFQRRLADPLGEGRIWLAGDAAHTGLPLAAHSMNAGLAETRLLVDAICDQLAGTEDPPVLSASASDRRRAARTLFGEPQDLVAHGEASDWVRQWRHRLVDCIPATGGHLTALLRQLGLERPR